MKLSAKTVLSVFWLVFTLSLVVWWWIYTYQLTDALQFDKVLSHKRMLFSEGITLLGAVVIGGSLLVFYSIVDERRARQQRLFFANFSHDVKTSIARLQLQAEILHEDQAENKIVKRLLKDIGRLNLQLENSLLFSNLEDGMLLKERISVRGMLDSLREEFDELRIHVEGNALVEGDSRAIKSIFRNILENSIAHGKASELFVAVSAARGQLIRLEARDNGVGSGLENRKLGRKLFRSKESNGSGIGLYLSARLAQKMGGRMEFSGAPGNGFTNVLHFRGEYTG